MEISDLYIRIFLIRYKHFLIFMIAFWFILFTFFIEHMYTHFKIHTEYFFFFFSFDNTFVKY